MKKLILATLAALALTACGDKNYYTTNPETEDIELRDTVMVYDTLVVNDTIETFDTTYNTIVVYDTIRTNDTVVVGVEVHDTTYVEDVVRDTLVVTDTIYNSSSRLSYKILEPTNCWGDAYSYCKRIGMRLPTFDEAMEIEFYNLVDVQKYPYLYTADSSLIYFPNRWVEISWNQWSGGSACIDSDYTNVYVNLICVKEN